MYSPTGQPSGLANELLKDNSFDAKKELPLEVDMMKENRTEKVERLNTKVKITSDEVILLAFHIWQMPHGNFLKIG